MRESLVTYIVEPRAVIGGGVRAALNLMVGLQKYHSASADIFGVYAQSNLEHANHIWSVDYTKSLSLRYIKDFHHYLKNQQPRIVQCFGLYTLLLAVIHKKMFCSKYKIVCTVHRFTDNVRFGAVVRLINPFLSKNVDYVTFLTKAQKNHYFTKLDFTPLKNSVVPNVIFTDEKVCGDWENFRKSVLLDTNSDYLITYVGRLIPDKNIEDFIKIIALTRKQGINTYGMIVGGGEDNYVTSLKSVAKENRVDDYISFVGFVNNPLLYIKASDIILSPTKREALPNLIIESFALGKPVLVSSIPQLKGIVVDGHNGFMAPLSDLNAFVAKIKRIINDLTLRASIVVNAKNTYKKYYEPRVVTDNYYTIYKDLYED